jgi:RNA exonuclease 4
MNNMELKALSNNWKKLQETLKKESSGTKRKSSEHETGHHRNGVKRRKAEITINKDLDRVGKPLRSKRMTEVVKVETRSEGGPVLSARRNSVASSRTAQPREGQVNEGLSTR